MKYKNIVQIKDCINDETSNIRCNSIAIVNKYIIIDIEYAGIEIGRELTDKRYITQEDTEKAVEDWLTDVKTQILKETEEYIDNNYET